MSMLGGYRVLIVLSTWLLTFAAHALLSHLLALVAGRTTIRSARLRSVLWKAALVLPFITATLATAGWRPMLVRRDLNLPDVAGPVAEDGHEKIWVEQRTVRTAGGTPETDSFITTSSAITFAVVVTALAVLSALLGTMRLIARHRAFRRRLGVRTRIVACDGATTMEYRLTASTTLGAPVALGRHEICVPARIFSVLSVSERRSVLAHERAHLARHDPAWFAFGDCLVALFLWLPLIRLVVGAMRRDAEFCCDEAVVRAEGDGRALVRSLATFARAFDPAETALAASCTGSPLEERARRILDPVRATGWGSVIALATAVLTLSAGIAIAAPAVTTRTMTIRRPPVGAGTERQIILIDRRI